MFNFRPPKKLAVQREETHRRVVHAMAETERYAFQNAEVLAEPRFEILRGIPPKSSVLQSDRWHEAGAGMSTQMQTMHDPKWI